MALNPESESGVRNVHGMNLRKIYTALLTTDLAAAEGWYTKLLGRGPDNRPMGTLVQWELSDQCGLALSTDDEIAGRGVVFLYVDDVATERRRPQAAGLGDRARGRHRGRLLDAGAGA